MTISLTFRAAYQEKYEEAESSYRRAVAVTESTVGANHMWCACALEDLAGLLLKQVGASVCHSGSPGYIDDDR